MKTLFPIGGSLALAALLLPALAQTPAPTPPSPRSAQPAARPTTHQLATGADPTVGRKFVEKSKPDVRPTPGKVRPRSSSIK